MTSKKILAFLFLLLFLWCLNLGEIKMADYYAAGGTGGGGGSSWGGVGTYWKGADGNVYVAGDSGVNNAGAWDDNTISYWNNLGYTQEADPVDPNLGSYPGLISGGSTGSTGDTGGTTPTAETLRRTQLEATYNNLNNLLGVYGGRKESGFADIDTTYNEKARLLAEQRAKANTGYDDQNNLAVQGRTRGYEQVDNYANTSANSLARIFQNANAGNSSVARLLAPQLVGKAADSRRLDVTETANQNLGGIKKARDEANTEFDYADQDVTNNRGYAKENFEKGLINEENDLFNQRLGIEQELGRDTTGTQNEINTRTQRLAQLFGAGKYNPQYQVKAVAPKAVSLNDYKVDPVAIQTGANPQSGGSFYAPQLKKKNELRVR